MIVAKVLALMVAYQFLCNTCVPAAEGDNGSSFFSRASNKLRKGGKCAASIRQLQHEVVEVKQTLLKHHMGQKKYAGIGMMIITHVVVPALLVFILTVCIFLVVMHQPTLEQPYGYEEDLPPSYEEAIYMEREE